MNKSIAFPASLKTEIRRIAAEQDYPLVAEIVARGNADELVVDSREEAQAIVDVARRERLDARLKYPYWDEESPRYDTRHEEAFQDIQMGFFEKVVMYIGQEYDIVGSV